MLIFGQGNSFVIMERALMIEAVALIMGARLYDWSGCFDYGGEAL